MVYVLPNGDVLAVQAKSPPVEPVKRPKDPIVGCVKNKATSFPGGPKAASRITLIREGADGKAALQVTLLDHLHSPFGVVWIDNTLYVANTDAVVAYPFVPGQTTITAPGKVLTELPGGPIDHHWTKSLTVSPDGQRLYATVGSNSNITENGIEAERGRAAVWEIDRASGRSRDLRQRPAQPEQPELLSRHQHAVGRRQRARRARAEPRPRLSDQRQGRCLLRLAVQLLRAARRSARAAAAARPGGEGDPARLCARQPRRRRSA